MYGVSGESVRGKGGKEVQEGTRGPLGKDVQGVSAEGRETPSPD